MTPFRSTISMALGAVLLCAAAARDRSVSAQTPAGREAVSTAGSRGPADGDTADVRTVVKRFHDALASGDSAAALALLAPDAGLMEGGASETREQYRKRHLASDVEFERNVHDSRSGVGVTVRGDAAWAVSTVVRKGHVKNKHINYDGAELIVLSRQPSGRWLIRAAHWSWRQRNSFF